MGAAPKVMLSQQHAVRLRTVTEHIDTTVGARISWRRLVEALRESGNVRPDEDVEAFVLDDDGINIFVQERERPAGFDDRDEVTFPEQRPWEPGGKIKVIFPDTITGGEWWRIFNPRNEVTVLAREPAEARLVVDALNAAHKPRSKPKTASMGPEESKFVEIALTREQINALCGAVNNSIGDGIFTHAQEEALKRFVENVSIHRSRK